uniref:Uncharacterized protein n=1 Tax=Arundo donax TaxID=35708 RepID=A0A0A9HLD8_ARUDO
MLLALQLTHLNRIWRSCKIK